MKKVTSTLKKLLLLLCCMLLTKAGWSQTPTYSYYIANEVQVSPTVYEFDWYVRSTAAYPLPLGGAQAGIGMNKACRGAGLVVPLILPGTTELSNPAQVSPTIVFNTTNATLDYITLSAGSPPGCASASLLDPISNGCTDPGTRICRIRLTNSIPWGSNTQPNHVFNPNTGGAAGITPSRATVYYLASAPANTCGAGNTNFTGGIPTFFNYNTAGTCGLNITLNPIASCSNPPTANAGSNFSVCGNGTQVNLNGTVGGQSTTYSWTGGTGTFNTNGQNATYTPSAGDYTAGSVVFTLNAADPDGAGPCSGATSNVTVTFTTPTNYYTDADGDGFGAGTAISACSQPAGTSLNNTDCNDNAASINPGAAEVCNGIDDDCDNQIDNGLTFLAYYVDGDGDTYGAGVPVIACAPVAGRVTLNGDCNDANAAINPGAAEVCNLIDDNCNGLTDEGVTLTFYADADGDTYGNPAVSAQGCTAPNGFVANNTDCNDANGAINPGANEVCNGIDDNCDLLVDNGLIFTTYYQDLDADNFGNVAVSVSACSPPAGYVLNSTDCNDNNAAINPNAVEVCNLIDDNCNGTADEGVQNTYYADNDGDTYGAGAAILACTPPVGSSVNNTDCNDNNAAINPGAAEICNSIDDNCNGLTDDGLSFSNYFADNDGDTFGAGAPISACSQPVGTVTNNTDCNDNNADVNPNAQEVCNGIDDDCDALTDNADPSVIGQSTYYADGDGDSFGAGAPILSCTQPAGTSVNNTDCNDNIAAINPGAQEVCNGIDDDCDGLTDSADPSVTGQLSYYSDSDGDGFGAGTAILACTQPVGTVSNNTDCNDNNAAVNPGAQEVCNGIDDDCDGLTDSADPSVTGQLSYYADTDGDGFGAGTATLACSQPAGFVTNNTDCNNNNAAINPNAAEVCNGIDDNCNGLTDDGLSFTNYYADLDGDTYGGALLGSFCLQPAGSVTTLGDCNDNNAAINPGAVEICNGIDDNCNSLTDEGLTFNNYYANNDGDGFGSTLLGSFCAAPANSSLLTGDCNDNNASIFPGAPEQCNGIDDNCNGLTDDGVVTSTWYQDADGDGFGNPAVSQQNCAQPVGYVLNNTDCNDASASVNPGASEVCNLIDDNCNGSTDEGVQSTFYADADGDGFGAGSPILACTQPAGTSINNTDCNDAVASIHPGATELCNNIDDNCNGLTDDGVVLLAYYADVDGDGYGSVLLGNFCTPPANSSLVSGDCNDANAAVNPGAAEVCNLIDDNCNGLTDEGVTSTFYADNDGDTFGDALATTNACSAPAGYVSNNTDCNDANAAVNPGASEVCNLIDDNCNGTTDEGVTSIFYADADGDSYGNPAVTTTGCTAPFGYVANSTDCNDGNAAINPGAAEVCNSIDDNCNGLTDEGLLNTYYADNDGDTYGAGSPILACSQPVGTSLNNTDCNDASAAVNPGATEVCNSIDDNCNGSTDEGFTLFTYYADVDGDSYGDAFNTTTTCSGTAPAGYTADNTDCNDANGNINPGATEVCANGIDDNCNGLTDEGCVGCQNPATAAAGNDQSICAGSNVTLAGSIGGGASNSVWTTSGSGTFSPNAFVVNPTYTPSPADIFTGSVTLTITTDIPAGCTAASDAMTVTINALPAAPGAISGPTQVCNPFNQTVTYSVAPVVGATVYTWTLPANTIIISGQGTPTLVVTWPFSAIHNGVVGNVCVETDNSNGCGSAAQSCLGISVQLTAPVTPPSISGPAKACINDLATYSIASVFRADTYTWTAPAGVLITSGQGTNIITVQFTAGYTGGTMSVYGSNGCGNGAPRNKTLGVNILTSPLAISGAADGVCGTVGQVYSIAAVPGAGSYLWTVPSGATIVSGQGTTSISVDFGGSFSSGNITVAATNNCGAGSSRSLTVKGAPGTPGVVNGPTSLCANATYIYDIGTVAGASTYTWTVPTGFTILSGQGTKILTVKAAANPATNLVITVKASNNCGTGLTRLKSGISIILCPRIGDATAGLNLVAFPNPVNDVLNVTFNSGASQNYNVKMVDATGRVVMAEARVAAEGSNQVEINVQDLASGIYMLQFQMNDHTEQIRIFVD